MHNLIRNYWFKLRGSECITKQLQKERKCTIIFLEKTKRPKLFSLTLPDHEILSSWFDTIDVGKGKMVLYFHTITKLIQDNFKYLSSEWPNFQVLSMGKYELPP